MIGKLRQHMTEQAVADQAPEASADDPESLFATSCGSCHVFSPAGTSGTTGPNLDDTTLGVEEVARVRPEAAEERQVVRALEDVHGVERHPLHERVGSTGLFSADVELQETQYRLRARLGDEGRDANRTMHAALALQQPVGVPTFHGERRRADPGLRARLHLGELDVPGAELCLGQRHAEHEVRAAREIDGGRHERLVHG